MATRRVCWEFAESVGGFHEVGGRVIGGDGFVNACGLEVEVHEGPESGSALARFVAIGHDGEVIGTGLADLEAVEHERHRLGDLPCFLDGETADVWGEVSVIDFEAVDGAEEVSTGASAEAHFEANEGGLPAFADVQAGEGGADDCGVHFDAVGEAGGAGSGEGCEIDGDAAVAAVPEGATGVGVGSDFAGLEGVRADSEIGVVEDGGFVRCG